MTVLFHQQQAENTRVAKPPLTSVRVALRWITAALLALVSAASSLAQATKPEHHLFLVDLSGSMRATPSGLKLSHLQLRQEKLRDWFQAHPNSLITLMSFNTDVGVPIDCDLGKPDDRKKANEWTDQLAIKKPLGTHLWTCLEKALVTAFNRAPQTPGQPVMLHVLTDGLNTERGGSLAEVMKNFPTAQLQPIQPGPQDLGDFDITISNTPESSSLAPTPTPSSTPLGSIGSTSPASPATATPSPSPSAGTVAFEIQEPRVVYSGQYVHFINKTSPPARSYSWTVKHNSSRTQEQNAAEPEEIELSSEHLVHQFNNLPGDPPQSYTVSLVARRGGVDIAANPITVLVKPPPSHWNLDTILSVAGNEKLMSALASLVTGVAGLVTSLAGACSVIARLWNKKSGLSAALGPEKWKWMFIPAAIACFVASVWFARDSSRAYDPQREREILFSPPPPVQPPVAQTPSPAPVINVFTQSSDRPAEVTSNSTAPETFMASIILAMLSSLFIITLAMTTAFVIFRREKAWDLRNAFGRSLAEQLDELERLKNVAAIPKSEVRAFYNAILKQARKRYGIRPVSQPELPELSEELKQLINKLITQTEEDSLNWKVVPESEEKASSATPDKSPLEQSDKTRSPRLSVDVGPIDKTKPSRPHIEIYPTNPGVGIAIFNRDGALIQTIDRHTFDLTDMELQIQRLYKIAKEPDGKIRETLKEILDNPKKES
jgi:hypothetical protein